MAYFNSILYEYIYIYVLRSSLDRDERTIHILVRLTSSDKKAIGTIRGSIVESANNENYYAKLSRLAVLKDYRQLKLGRVLVSALHDQFIAAARERSPTQTTVKVVTHAQLYVKGFYGK
jgi:predicted N-acetyltransferase YhbS